MSRQTSIDATPNPRKSVGLKDPTESRFIGTDLQDVSVLITDHDAQRPAHKAHVANIARNWKLDLAGSIQVAVYRGRLLVVDGQHRVLAARQVGVKKLRCDLYQADSEAEVSRMFIDLNTVRKRVLSVELYAQRLLQGDAVAKLVEATVQRHGWRVCQKLKSTTNYVRGVGWCYKYATLDADRFVRVMSFALPWFADSEQPADERMLSVLWRIDTICDGLPSWVTKKLYKISYAVLLRKARSLTLVTNNSYSPFMIVTFRELNHGQRANKLPEATVVGEL
jgi:hypothetical protein